MRITSWKLFQIHVNKLNNFLGFILLKRFTIDLPFLLTKLLFLHSRYEHPFP